MSQDNPIIVSVPFHGDTITCIETPEGVFVPLKPLCEGINLDFSAQYRRMNRDLGLWGIAVMATPSALGGQEMACIPVNRIAAWLFSMDASRVKPEVQERLRLYQREAADVLDRHFRQLGSEKDEIIAIQAEQLAFCHAELVKAQPRFAQIHYLWRDVPEGWTPEKPRGLALAKYYEMFHTMQECGLLPLPNAADAKPASTIARVREMRYELIMAKSALQKAGLPLRQDTPEPVQSDLEAHLQRRAAKTLPGIATVGQDGDA